MPPSAYELPRITAATSDARALDADLMAIPFFQAESSTTAAMIDEATGGELQAALDRGEFSGKIYELFTAKVTAAGWKVSRIVLVGGGPRADASVQRLRRMAASVGSLARQQRLGRIGWLAEGTEDGWLQAVAEGVTVANFDPGHYKSRDVERFFLTEVTICGSPGEDAEADLERGKIVGEAVNAARVLINEPGNELTPSVFAERAKAVAGVAGVQVDILDERRMEELQMGLLLGVARGSAEPPRMIVFTYQPDDAPATPVLGLIGKGITFDTGGISLKPADGMERMKDDMAGGAAVVAAMRAIALQKIPLRVIAVVPCAENMPGGRATKPGDVLRGASGLTVEVNNTDAEGRLVLGDGMWYAQQLGATHLVDIATLTGACVVALGKVTTGLFASPEGWVTALEEAADRAGERVWPLPVFDEYKESLKSDIADMINSPGRPAGAITAAMFLKEFAGDRPWAHLDIAGTAWADEAKSWTPKGATGVMVSTLVELARSAGRGWPAV